MFSPLSLLDQVPAALNTTNRPLVDTGHLPSALSMHLFSFETKREKRYSQKRENLMINKVSRNHSGMCCVHVFVSVAIMEMWRPDWLSGRVHTADSCCAYTMYTMTPQWPASQRGGPHNDRWIVRFIYRLLFRMLTWVNLFLNAAGSM